MKEETEFTTGTCRWCGQRHFVPGPAQTQEEADIQATAGCKCPEGEGERRRSQERDIISAMFAELDEETIGPLYNVAEMLRGGFIGSGTTIKVGENVSAKFKMKDGAVIVTRSEKPEHQHSI